MRKTREPGPISTAHRIPSLDGLRALSIALVIVGHVQTARIGEAASRSHPLSVILGNGPFGVSVFFVISGFLITTLLLRELDRSDTISLRGFYWRRAFRILPAYAAYLAVVAALGASGHISVAPREFAAAATFTKNYTPWQSSWSLLHTWSLSVEEQFYLLWPTALLFAGRNRARRIAIGIILLSPIIRVANYAIFGGVQPGLWEMLHTRADALMFGCLGALEYDSQSFRDRCLRAFPLLFALIPFVFVVQPLITARFGGSLLYTVGYTFEGITILLSMLWVIEHPASVVGRLLNSRIVAHVGVISYSLYLWQQLMLDPAYFPGRVPLCIAGIFVAAELSYHLVEQPMLRWRERLSAAKLPTVLASDAILPPSRPSVAERQQTS